MGLDVAENEVDKVAVLVWTSKVGGSRKKSSSCNPPSPRGQRSAVQGKGRIAVSAQGGCCGRMEENRSLY